MSAKLPEHLPSVAGLIPPVFDRYARILHPVEIRGGRTDGPKFQTWSDFAQQNGKVMHPLVQFGCIEDPPNRSKMSGRQLYYCDWDSLEIQPFHSLLEVLSRHTLTDQTCWFCQWEGCGIIGALGPRAAKNLRTRFTETEIEFAETEYRTAPFVDAIGRKYVLFSGDLSAAYAFHEPRGLESSPNFMWPDDRSWIVTTELDVRSTYVGGSSECIEEILSHPDLETYEANADDLIWESADTINC